MPSWFSNLFGFASAKNSSGNFAWGVTGDVVQVLVQARADLFGGVQTEPDLPFTKLDYAIEKGEPNIASLLRWNYQLVETLYGRSKEVADIEEWANDPRPEVLLRLIEGEGGSGKTRLGAEVARVLRKKGWQAGFLPRSGSVVHTPTKLGLLLIVDYPEEQLDRVRALVESIQSCRQPGYRLRILLLSRRRYRDWGSTFAHIEDLVGEQSIATLGSLTHDDTRNLVLEASRRLREKLGRTGNDDFHDLDGWLNADQQHRLSLYATAAAVHHVLAPEATFGLRAADIMIDLVKRETSRVNKASEAARLGEDALSRLLALATVAGTLTPTEIGRLAKPDLQIFGCDENQAMNRLRALPWWDSDTNALPALTPDILAAAFTSHVLKKTPDMAPRWLWAALQNGIGADFAARMGRVIYDIDLIDGAPSELPRWLEATLEVDAAAAIQFMPLTIDDRLPHRLAGLAAAAGTALGGVTQDEEQLAALLNNASINLVNAGRNTAALAAAQRAVEICERLAATDLARFEPVLASSLNNLANLLNKAGDGPAALAATRRAVEIYERIAAANPARFEPELAASLNNLSNRLGDADDNPTALAAAQRAVEIRERLAAAKPARFEPDLAESLNNLSNRLGDAHDNPAALAAAQRAVEIYERLAATNPARFEPELGTNLQNLAITLDDMGQRPLALTKIREAVKIYDRLAVANAARFGFDLAWALEVQADIASRSGENDLACSSASHALPIWRLLTKENPRAYLRRLLRSLALYARVFAAAGRDEEAREAAEELAGWENLIQEAQARASTDAGPPPQD